MFSLFDVIIFLIYRQNKIKYLGLDFQRPIFEIIAAVK